MKRTKGITPRLIKENSVIIKETELTPKVVFDTNGNLLLKGWSLFLNADEFYFPLIQWVKNARCHKINLSIEIEYMNSLSLKKIVDIFLALDKNRFVREKYIRWNFYLADDLLLDVGMVLQEILSECQFEFLIDEDII